MIMKFKTTLLTVLPLASVMSFASVNGAYTTVGPLQGNAVVGKEASFAVSYKWLTDKDRTGKIIYNVIGTDCHGSVDIDKHSGMLPVSGEVGIQCKFDKSAVFQTDTVLQLYEGDVEKEVSEHQAGNITVTAE